MPDRLSNCWTRFAELRGRGWIASYVNMRPEDAAELRRPQHEAEREVVCLPNRLAARAPDLLDCLREYQELNDDGKLHPAACSCLVCRSARAITQATGLDK